MSIKILLNRKERQKSSPAVWLRTSHLLPLLMELFQRNNCSKSSIISMWSSMGQNSHSALLEMRSWIVSTAKPGHALFIVVTLDPRSQLKLSEVNNKSDIES